LPIKERKDPFESPSKKNPDGVPRESKTINGRALMDFSHNNILSSERKSKNEDVNGTCSNAAHGNMLWKHAREH
jgi:hypothetical protein